MSSCLQWELEVGGLGGGPTQSVPEAIFHSARPCLYFARTYRSEGHSDLRRAVMLRIFPSFLKLWST